MGWRHRNLPSGRRRQRDAIAALAYLLPLVGYEHMDERDLRREHELGNGFAMPLLNARAAVATLRRAAP